MILHIFHVITTHFQPNYSFFTINFCLFITSTHHTKQTLLINRVLFSLWDFISTVDELRHPAASLQLVHQRAPTGLFLHWKVTDCICVSKWRTHSTILFLLKEQISADWSLSEFKMFKYWYVLASKIQISTAVLVPCGYLQYLVSGPQSSVFRCRSFLINLMDHYGVLVERQKDNQ